MKHNPAYNTTDKTIAIDFDGVIHKNSLGYHDGTIYDNPIENTAQSLKYIKEILGFNIIIFSTKARTDRPLIKGSTGTYLIWQWLKKHKLDLYINDVTAIKPPAAYYIDDKGITFTSWSMTIWLLKERMHNNNIKK